MRPAGAAQIGRLCSPMSSRGRMEATTDAGAPNFALAEYKAPENFPTDTCPMCKAGLPITKF